MRAEGEDPKRPCIPFRATVAAQLAVFGCTALARQLPACSDSLTLTKHLPVTVNCQPQAKAVGDQLVVGLINDAEILRCKGPPVMNEEERGTLVDSVKWVDEILTGASVGSPGQRGTWHAGAVRMHACMVVRGRVIVVGGKGWGARGAHRRSPAGGSFARGVLAGPQELRRRGCHG